MCITNKSNILLLVVCPQGALVGGTCFGESSHEMNKHETKSSVKDKALHYICDTKTHCKKC